MHDFLGIIIYSMNTNHYKTKKFLSMISKRYFLVLALFFGLQNAWGQSVIMYGDYYLKHGTDGHSVETNSSTGFNPSTCIWYLDNNTVRTANANGEAFSGNCYLQTGSVSLGNSATWVQAQNGSLMQATDNNYLRQRSNGTWQIGNYNSNRATAYAVDIQNIPANTTITALTINPSSVSLNLNESQTFTVSATATTTPAYTVYTFNGNTIYYFNNTTYTSLTAMQESSAWASATVAPTVTYTWTLTGAANSYLSPTSGLGSSITITHSTQAPSNLNSTLTVTASATANGQTGTSTSSATVTALAPQVDPESITVTTPMTVYVGQTGTVSYTLTPNPCYNNVTFTSANTGIATVSSTGVVTGVAAGQTTISVKAYKYSDPSSYVEATVTVNVRDKVATPVITFTPSREGGMATTTITCATAGAAIYYKVNGGEYAEYSSSFTVNEYDEVWAYAVKTGSDAQWWDDSETAHETYVSCTTYDPVITSNNGSATITAETGATIYCTYGVDPDDPTTTTYDETGTTSVTISGLTNGQVVKAIAKNGSCSVSNVVSVIMVVSGISGSQVILYDLEDHNWSYYNAAPDTDYYPSDVLLSPDPRNVKITYRGGSVAGASAVAVSTTEPQNEFVYYKTIEKLAWGNGTGRWLQGNYAYRTIPNPFSKRPRTNGTTGTNGFWGFNGWKVLDGGEYIQEYNDDQIIPADQLIHFVGLPAGNNGSGEIVLEAQWTAASVVTRTTDINSNPNGLNGTSYETNFIVYTDNGIHTVSGLTTEATISSNYPNGDPAGSNGPATISNFTTSTAAVKLEYIKIGDGNTPIHPINPTTPSTTALGNGTFTANSGELIVGRGCTGTVNYVCSGGNGGQYKYRIESGKYQFMFLMSSGSANPNNYGRIVLGCDYDRAADDGEPGNGTGDNTKLRVVNYCTLNGGGAAGVDDSELLDITVKSGYYGFSANRSLFQNSEDPDGYGLGIGGNTDMYSAGWGTQDYTTIGPDNTTSITYQLSPNRDVANNKWKALMSFYVGPTRGAAKGGVNRMLVEGGEFCSINGGGTTPGNDNTTIGFYFRMKGGWVKGAVYGTASITTANGSRRLVFTGGEVNGWVAGACNGTDFGNDVSTGNYNGINNGICYIYAGGSTEFRSHDGQGNYNNAYGLVGHVEGGQIFGAGRGLAPQRDGDPTYCGSTTTAYVAVADEAYVEQNVYGGGYNGITQNSYVYILGGTVGKKVFGGTARAVSTRVDNNNWWCDKTIIRMYGGTVKGGIYGGHDETGLQYGDAEVTIYGGTVGDPDALNDPSKKGFVHGGGFGDKTVTGGNVIVTIGDDEHAGPTIYGEVYGGSALGNTNATARLDLGTTYPPTPQTVNVVDTTYNPGKVTNVILNKGAVHGNVYGGALGQKNGVNGATSNINAYVFGPVNVTVNGGYAINVFGCNNINGRPRLAVDVFIKGGTIAESVFGGGNMADYIGNPTVTVSGGLVMQHVFGGGFAAEVDGNTFVLVKDRAKIFRNVYGGGNKGVVTGDTQVIVNGELSE